MAGITVGGTTDDWILNSSTGLPLKRASKLRRYAALTGGSPLTLTLNGQSVTEIPVPPGGFYPEHTLPDGVTTTYVVALENANATDANFAAAPRYKEVPPGGGGGVSSYNDLTDKPATFPPAAHTQAASTVTGLATVATTGTYSDLSGKPTIPTTPGEVGAAAATHTHSATQISNSTTTGRNVLTAADKAAARTAIGLVTGTPAADEVQLVDTTAATPNKLLVTTTPTISPGIVNTTTETSMFDLTVTAAQVAAGDLLELEAAWDLLNNSGAAVTYTYKVKLGAVTVFQAGGFSINTSTTRYRAHARAVINLASLSDQRWKAEFFGANANASTMSSLTTATSTVGVNSTSVDLSTNQTLSITVTMSAAAATVDTRPYAATLRRSRVAA